MCRVETGENCTSPAPKEGRRTTRPPAPGDCQTPSVTYVRQVALEADLSGNCLGKKASNEREKLVGGGWRGGRAEKEATCDEASC